MPKTRSPIRRSFASSWSRWCGPGARRRIWPESLNRRPSRSATGWPRPIAMGVGVRRPDDRGAHGTDAAPAREPAVEGRAGNLVKSRGLVRTGDHGDHEAVFGFMKANQATFPVFG